MAARLQMGLFVVLLSFLGFCGGMFTGSLFVPAGSGFTGPAIAFGYGIGGLLAGLIASVLLIRGLKQPAFRIALLITIIVSLLMTGWIIYRVKSVKDQQTDATINFEHHSDKNINADFLQAAQFENNDVSFSKSMGLGVAKPHLSDGKVIYFYHLHPIYMQSYQIRPKDSIVISKGQYHFEIRYAPPWFFPEAMKMDYDILLMKTITLSRDWMEVIVNKKTNQTYWVARDDAEFTGWPVFLLNIFSISLINPEKNPLFSKPNKDAGIIATTPPRFELQPLAIQEDWMMVSTNGLADRIVPTGWIRWRNKDSLLIRYSLLN